MGDNVVWEVSDVEEFRMFALPFVVQAINDKRDIVYIRFAQHPPILSQADMLDHVQVAEFDPDAGFESFTVAINMDKDGDFVINLLQCRPLYLGGESLRVCSTGWIP